ncbi:8-oxoguanine deaminase [Elusimicrobiota bacterium]
MSRSRKSILLKNALVVGTMNDKGDEISGCDILIEGREIKKVGKNIRAQGARVINVSGCVVVPGFVNTHHHLFQTLTRAIAQVQDAKLFDWLVHLYGIWKRVTPEAVYTSALVGLGELMLTGCTTSSDHFYIFPKGRGSNMIDSEIDAAKKLGIRFHPCRGSMSRGKSKGGLPPDEVVQSEDVIMKDSERVVKKFHDPEKFSMCRIALAPCSPFSVTTDLLKLTAEASCRWKVRLHTHLAETIDEEEYCKSMCGMRPLEYLDSVGWVGPGSWFAHCVHMDPGEIKRMAQAGACVAHCPTSNLRLGSGIAPVRNFLNAGVCVSLGVDGSASNDASDMLGEVRQCMLVHRVKTGVDSMTARDALRIATRGGAKALGRDDIGSIEPGKAADIAVFDLDRIDFAGACHDPLASIVFAGASHRAKWVIANGKIVVKNGMLVNINEQKLVKQANKAALKLANN